MILFNKKYLLAALAFSLPVIAIGQERNYQAPYDRSDWQVETSKLACKMYHKIPEYGLVEFDSFAGMEEEFKIEVGFNRVTPWKSADIEFNVPAWRKKVKDKPNGWQFNFDENRNAKFDSLQTRRLLNALSSGFVPYIKHKDAANSLDNIKAEISIINFDKAYQEYSMCQSELVPVTFKEIANTDILFETASSLIEDKYQKWLDSVVAYAEHLNVRKIDLSGYTDSVGTFRANYRLASARVKMVKDYLISKGIPKEKIIAKVFGEHRPKEANNTKEGRALNRRVNIKIVP